MSISESGGRPFREKWPFSFDLEGVPRDTAVRTERLKQLRGESMADVNNMTMSHEQIEALREFLLQHDRGASQNVFDLSKPPKVPYIRGAGNDFPKMVYGHEGKFKGHVLEVKHAEAEEDALARGYSNSPHPEYDYSRIDRNSMKAAKIELPAELDASDEREAQRDVEAANEKAEAYKKARKAKSLAVAQ